MNAGVSPRGSPTPKSMSSRPSRSARAFARSSVLERIRLHRPQGARSPHGRAVPSGSATNAARTSKHRARQAASTSSSSRWASAGSPGPKFTASTPAVANSATGVHACFGPDVQLTGVAEPRDEGVSHGDRTRLSVGQDVDLRSAAREHLEEPRLRLRGGARRSVAEVHPTSNLGRDHVGGHAPLDHRDARDLSIHEPVDLDVHDAGIGRPTEASHRGVDRVLPEPWASGVRAPAAERHGGVQVAQTADLERVRRRLHHDREVGRAHRRRSLEQREEGAPRDRQLLSAEEQQADVDGRCEVAR